MKNMLFFLISLLSFASGYAMQETSGHNEKKPTEDIKVQIGRTKTIEYAGLFTKKMDEWYGGTKPPCLFCESGEACDM